MSTDATIFKCVDANNAVWGFYQIEQHQSNLALMVSGNASLACSDAPFTSAMVGWGVSVLGAGPAGGVLQTTISAFVDASHVTLAVAASTSPSFPTTACFMPPRVDYFGFLNGSYPVMVLENGDASFQNGLYFKTNDGAFTYLGCFLVDQSTGLVKAFGGKNGSTPSAFYDSSALGIPQTLKFTKTDLTTFLAELSADATSGDLSIYASKGGSNPAIVLQSGKTLGQFYANDTNGIAKLVAAPLYDGQIPLSNVGSAQGVAYSNLAHGAQQCSSPLTLSTTYTDIAGCSASLPRGFYRFSACVTIDPNGSGEGTCEAALNVNGTIIGGTAQLTTISPMIATVSYEWFVSLSATQTVKLQGRKANAGGSAVITSNSVMNYLQIG